jgi:hypothetical protein
MMAAAAAAALTVLAIIAQDQVALRATPATTSTAHAQLWQGELVEVRGRHLGQLQVYDHRIERAGFIRESDAHIVAMNEAAAPDLLAVVRFLRDTPGAESLGIAYAAAYLKAAPSTGMTPEVFDALGVMAERLARGAVLRPGKVDAVTAHMDVATQYGVKFISYAGSNAAAGREAVQLCYDGDAFRRVLAMDGSGGSAKASVDQRARAILALTRPDCVDPALSPGARKTANRERADLLDTIDAASAAQLAVALGNQLHMRRAGAWSAIAFDSHDSPQASQAAARRAIDELAAVDKSELHEGDAADYAAAAIRVGTVRWAAETAVPGTARLQVELRSGEPGQTCARLVDRFAKTPAALAEHCTYGTIWPASARPMPEGRALALSVEPIDGWGELWVWHQEPDGWKLDVVTPESGGPGLGYVEWAGWSPAARGKVLVVRETMAAGRIKRRFEVLRTDTLVAEKSASDPGQLAAFGLWSDVVWKQGTVSLR